MPYPLITLGRLAIIDEKQGTHEDVVMPSSAQANLEEAIRLFNSASAEFFMAGIELDPGERIYQNAKRRSPSP